MGINIDIQLKRACFHLDFKASFDVGITGIFGKSGVGKTTLLQCISGMSRPDEGRISMDGVDLFNASQQINVAAHRRQVGYVFQDGRLFPHLNVRKNLMYGCKFLNNRTGRIEFDDMVDILEIGTLLNQYPQHLSGGQKQRVAIGRALMAAPKVLLLDEPFSALDYELRQSIIPYLSSLSKSLSIPILIVSHDLPDILRLTEQICLMADGKVVAHSSYHQLLEDDRAFSVLPKNDVLNMITLVVKKIFPKQGIIQLNGRGTQRHINILFEDSKKHLRVGDAVRVFLRPNDIVLSIHRIEGSSFQNQIEGVVLKMNKDGVRVLCHIDCGFLIIAELSQASLESMQISIGKRIYCSFKTLALDSITV